MALGRTQPAAPDTTDVIRLASILLLIVVLRNYAPDAIGAHYAEPGYATRSWDYIFGGIQGFALFAVIAMMTGGRPLKERIGVLLVCGCGLFEESQRAVCRLAIGIPKDAKATQFSGLCENITGWPIFAISALVVLVVVVFADVQWRVN